MNRFISVESAKVKLRANRGYVIAALVTIVLSTILIVVKFGEISSMIVAVIAIGACVYVLATSGLFVVIWGYSLLYRAQRIEHRIAKLQYQNIQKRVAKIIDIYDKQNPYPALKSYAVHIIVSSLAIVALVALLVFRLTDDPANPILIICGVVAAFMVLVGDLIIATKKINSILSNACSPSKK